MALSTASALGSRRTIVAFTALVLGAVAMGASPIFVRIADVGPYASAFWRTFLALPFLAAWAYAESGSLRPSFRVTTDRAVLLSGLFFTGDLFFWHLSILSTTFTGRERARAFAAWGAVAGAGVAFGPVLGGWLTTSYSWRWSFRINLIVTPIAIVGALVFMRPTPRTGRRQRIDVGGLFGDDAVEIDHERALADRQRCIGAPRE